MRNPEITRESILRTSGILFNTQGYKATSISDITKATGYTKGAIYRHFSNKDALELETLMHLSGLMFKKLGEKIESQPTAGSKLRAVFNFFRSYVSNPPLKGGCPLMNTAIEADDAHPALKEGALNILNILHGSVKKILENGIKYKQIKPEIDTGFYATLIIASLEGAIMMSKLRNSDEDLQKVVKHLDTQLSAIEL